MDESHLFHRGLSLFNVRDFFEAHETWEDMWHLASGERKLFYQGLIQCAVTLVHVQRGNPRGVVTVWTTAQQKFEKLPGSYMGVDLADLQKRMAAFLEPVLAMPRDAYAPGKGRGISLPVNMLDAPQITLAVDPFA